MITKSEQKFCTIRICQPFLNVPTLARTGNVAHSAASSACCQSAHAAYNEPAGASAAAADGRQQSVADPDVRIAVAAATGNVVHHGRGHRDSGHKDQHDVPDSKRRSHPAANEEVSGLGSGTGTIVSKCVCQVLAPRVWHHIHSYDHYISSPIC